MMDAHDVLAVMQAAARRLAASVARQHGVDLAESVFLVAPKSRSNVLGWFYANSWTSGPEGGRFSEIAISAEFLDREPEDVATTIVHELVHLAAFQRGIKDTSRQGRWHNHRFGELALDFGLKIGAPKEPYGVQTTGLTPPTQLKYARELNELAEALVIYREIPTRPRVEVVDEPDDATVPDVSNPTLRRTVRATCCCSIGRGRARQITVPAGSWEPDSIECRVCGEAFVETDPRGAA